MTKFDRRSARLFSTLALLLLVGCRQLFSLSEAELSKKDAEILAGQGGESASGVVLGGESGHDPSSHATGGTLDGDDDSVAASGGSPETPATPCEQYCTDMDAFCDEGDAQFTSSDQCLKTCSVYEEGELGQEGNTQACRLKYVGKGRYAAGSELSAYCRQAGPAGSDVCGSICDGYCSVMMAACTAETSSLYHYADWEACLSDCESLPAPSDIPFSVGNPDVFDGGHVQCRLFHALSALMLDAEEHCEHAMGVTLCEITE